MGAHHHHHHHHGHAQEHAEGRHSDSRKVGAVLVVTSLILIAEAVGGWLTHSLALLSDAGHMLSDVVGLGLSLAALKIAARPADARRTYGWHRVEILAALGNGLVLLVIAIA